MKIKRLLLVGMLLFLSVSSSALFAELSGKGDWQYWNTEIIEGQILPKLRVELEQEFRFGDDFSDFYHEHSQILFGYKLLNWLEIAPNYRQTFEEKKGVFRPEQNPQIDFTGKWTLQGWDVSNRHRVGYRDKSGKPNTVLYRNQVKIRFPFSWTQWKIRPYVAEEIFVESRGEGLNRNRLSTGLEIKILEHLKGDIFFLWQTTDTQSDWVDIYILGSKLKWSF